MDVDRLSPGDLSTPMWNQICRMPFSHLEETTEFKYIEKVMSLCAQYSFSQSDSHMTDPNCTICLAKLLKLVCEKCTIKVHEFGITEQSLQAKIAVQNKEIIRLQQDVEDRRQLDQTDNRSRIIEHTIEGDRLDIQKLKIENDKLHAELRKVTKLNEHLSESQDARHNYRIQADADEEKFRLEYKHLVSRFGRLQERLRKTEADLEEMRKRELETRVSGSDELDRLRQKVEALVEDNYKLVESRDYAEDQCERREAKALHDLTELQRLTESLLSDKDHKYENMKEECNKTIQSLKYRIEELMNSHEQSLQEREEEITHLRIQYEKLQAVSKKRFEFSSSSSASSVTSQTATVTTSRRNAGATSEQQLRLERENDDLIAEVEQFELRIDALEEENQRLNRLVKDYERGNDGLLHLRQELSDASRRVENLQTENQQLRERLNNMEDSLTFTTALQELCKKVGVTDDEINSLRPHNTAAFSEIDTLKEEVNTLKEEVEWLEKERRHWMDKVRLQPLMDTKLRFELGLTSEQLKQLDDLVDQMKCGSLIVEDEENTNYKEKYFLELQARRKDAEQFNEYVRGRIDESLRSAFMGLDIPNMNAALDSIKEHIDVISTLGPTGLQIGNTQMQDQLDSVTHRLEQANITIADREETIVRLREDLAGSTAARDAIAKERDQYRETLFSSAGFAAQADDDDVNEDDMTESLRLPRGNSKWRALFSTLRDQLDAKDSIISTLGKQMNELRDKIKDQQKVIESAELRIEAEQQEEASLHDKIAVLSELNEELGEKNSSLKRINLDLEESVKRFESSGVSNDVQKIVLLRRREAKLMQRLRRALTAKDKSSTAEESMRNSMGTVFASLKEALEGTSTGFVLPPATCRTSEEDMLVFLQQSVSNLLSGKLFREDSRYLLQLQHIYHNLEQQEELNEFRVNSRNRDNEIKSLQHELDERTAEVEQLAAFKNKLSDTQGRDEDIDYHRAASARWQSEAISWKKKCELFTARLELKEKEVSALERDVDCSRMEIVGMKEQVENLLRMSGESSSVGISTERREGTQVSDGAPHTPVSVSRLEREVARLKSINLGLLQYSVELQSSIKGLEIDLETKSQEVTLLKESGGSPVVSDFISGAIREHAALRRQGELALIQNRRLRIQLAATEANYQVVSNEANSYRHSAYRLYRRYVSDTLSMVDYFRHVQRESKGSLPPHRVDIMHRRFHRVLSALHTSTARSTALSADVAEKASFITSLEQQIGMMQLDASGDISDAMESQLREANVKMRQSCRQLTELEEDCKYAQSKSVRLEKHIELLNEEITRLEFGVMKVSNTEDDSIVARLIALKDEVFTKAEAPSVTPQPLTLRAAYQSGDDGDVAIREYKAVAMRLDECVRECARLKQDADQQRAETRKKDGINEELRLEVQRLEQSISAGQRQLEEERQKFELREQRLSSTHQIQSDVARRASEQNAQSLSDLLRKKDETIAQLQEQLRVERQKALSYQLEESARMERLHEHMFRDNSAVVERFRVAIEGIGENIPDGSAVHTAGANQDSPMTEQLRHLTAETIRLTKELKDARTTNIILESQLSSQLEKSQIQLHLINTSPSTTAGSPPQAVVPSNTDAVMSLARSQSTMIESIRKREAALTDELHRERELRISLQGQLEAAQIRHVEQGGSLQLLSQVSRSSESPLVAELRAQTAFLEQELHNTRELLETERAAAQRLKGDAEDWQSNLTALQSEVTGQRAEVERAKHLASLNEALQGDVRALQEQNEKLILASTVLKQKLMEEARRGGDSSRQHQQELALAQRMGAIQSESVAQMKVLDVRMKAIQAELNDRVIKESDMLQKNEEAQRMIYQLHLQIRSKDREIVELKSKKGIPTPGVTASASAPGAPPAAAAMTVQKGTQAHTAAVPTTAPVEAPTVVAAAQDSGNVTEGAISSAERAPASTKRGPPAAPEVVAPEVLLQPQLAGLVNREVQRQQRDQLQQISTLRGTANRLEKDLSEVRDHLANERQTSRSLRVRIQELQAQKEESEAEHSRELVRLHRIKLQSGDKSVSHPSTRVETSVPAPAVSSSVVAPHPASVSSAIPAPVLPVGSMVHSVPIVEGDVQKLRERVVELEASAASAEMYKQQVEVLRRQQLPGGFVPFLPSASTAQVPPVSPEVKQWLSEGSHTEEVIHDLRHKLEVEAPRVLREMEVKFHHQERLADRLFSELAKVKSSTTEEVREEFGGVAGVTPVERSLEELETELLHKTSEVCALRFSAESSALKVSRLRQQLEGLQQLDEAHTRKLRSNHNEMEMLETLVSNLKLLMSRLQKENMELREQVPHREHYAELLAQARSWQEKERELKSMIERLSAQCASAGIEQHQQWQRALAAAQAEVQRYKTELLELRQRVSLQIPTSSPSASMLYRRVTPLEEAEAVPPPLPPAPFTSSNRSTASPDTQPQRRLSSRDPGGSNPALNSADYHASRLGRRS